MSLKPPYPDVLALIQRDGQRLPPDAIKGADWSLTDTASADRLSKMRKSGVPLKDFVKGQIYYGIKTGLGDAFYINSQVRNQLIAEDPKSADLIHPLAIGRDVQAWSINYQPRWMIFTRRGVDIMAYPAIERHLSQWRSALEPRPRDWDTTEKWPGRKPGSYKWYEIQDEVAYYHVFDKPKIVYQRF